MTKAPAKIGCLIVVVVLWATLSASQEAPTAQGSPAPAAQPSPRAAQEPQGQNQTPPLPPTSDPKEIVRRATEVDHHNFERAQ
ncbi:MAG TPA: hypothetical protein VGQ61_14745, partial [Candidatus Angelobacter sp.]|nr:hypothetical protein [Candidatus Angelobacter sp.]